MRLLAAALVCMFLSAGLNANEIPPYLGIYVLDDSEPSHCANGAGLHRIYCFAASPVKGLDCYDFNVSLNPATSIYMFGVDLNEDIILSMGEVPGDIVACFGECQYGVVELFSAFLVVDTAEEGYVEIKRNSGSVSDFPVITDCNIDEIEIETVWNLWANQDVSFCIIPFILLEDVSVIDVTQIRAIFNNSVGSSTSADEFVLCTASEPFDTIPIVDAFRDDADPSEVDISLGEPLFPGVVYTLSALGVFAEWWISHAVPISKADFTSIPVAVMLQGFEAENVMGGVELSWRLAEASGDVSFTVSRRSALTGISEELDLQIERDGESYSCIDADIEPGESYVYRVDYVIDGETSLLFETDAVQTPALPLTLDQNVPNPFNPTTEISYYLPAAADVLLEVYDVTGKRIATLVRGREEKGPRTVNWHGTDDFGRGVASGIYFYRLSAGKETISKKMVLLR
jgi:hypothetical protein